LELGFAVGIYIVEREGMVVECLKDYALRSLMWVFSSGPWLVDLVQAVLEHVGLVVVPQTLLRPILGGFESLTR
jgi:hypothetical protein